MRIVKAYVREEYEIARFGELSEQYLRKNLVWRGYSRSCGR